MLQCNIFSYKHYDTVKERNDKMALLIKADAKKSYLLSYNYGSNELLGGLITDTQNPVIDFVANHSIC